MDSRTILVTGGTGLVGHGIKWALESGSEPTEVNVTEQWHFLGSRDGDMRKLEDVDAIFQRYKPTHIIHLAALVFGSARQLEYPVEIFKDNMMININLLEMAHKHKVARVVSILSTCALPPGAPLPLSEDSLHTGEAHASNYAYAYSKRMLDVLSRAYRDQHGCDFSTVIPTNVFGPNDNFSSRNAHFIPGITRKALFAKEKGLALKIAGSGGAHRQFVYSRDLGRILIRIIRSPNPVPTMNISGSKNSELSVREVVEMICKVTGFSGEINYDKSSSSEGPLYKTADNSRQFEFLSHGRPFHFTPFETALNETIEWFQFHREIARL